MIKLVSLVGMIVIVAADFVGEYLAGCHTDEEELTNGKNVEDETDEV